MKKIYEIIITIAVCALCVCSFFAVRSQRENQNELNNLEKEAAPYQDEINDIYAELQSRKQKLGSPDNSNAGATLAFVPASANDIDTIRELMTGYNFTPTIIADCSIDSKELDSIIRKSQNNNYDILLSGMTFDDDVLASAIKVRNNLTKNNYNLKETFFLRHTYDTDEARKSLLDNDYSHLVCYNETFASGTASNGMLYISYSFIRSSNAFTNLINQAISTNNDAVMIFDFADMQDGTINDSTITGFLEELSSKISEGSINSYTLSQAFEALENEETLSQIANDEYEQYKAEQESRIAELESKVHEIYGSRKK